MTAERRFKLSEEDLKEIIRGYIVRKMGDDCVVKDMKSGRRDSGGDQADGERKEG